MEIMYRRKFAYQCLDAAINTGINFFDTAEIYGNGAAEAVIGDFFAQSSYDRDDYVISSKVFWPISDNINRYGNSRKNILRAIEGTLTRLKTDYLDIYFMHRFDYSTPVAETVLTLTDLIHAGKIRYWGTSAWTAAQLEQVAAVTKDLGAIPPIVEQPLYNMLFRHVELEILSVGQSHGMGFMRFLRFPRGS